MEVNTGEFDPQSEKNILQKISEERKLGIKNGDIPDWFVTPSYQMFKAKYVWKGQTVKDTYKRIAKCAASHMVNDDSDKDWEATFFELLWNGWLSPSTPILANMGTSRGCNVACSGGVVGDSIYDFYNSQLEVALLTQAGFGTSSYLGNIRERGSPIASGGTASGIVPVFDDFVQLSRDVSQGNTRRGAWAGYIPITHGDFYEFVDHFTAEPDDVNVGWNITDEYINQLKLDDPDAHARFSKSLKTKCLTGKGYYFFVDKVNRANPPMYKDHGLSVKASNLCLHRETMITVYGKDHGTLHMTMGEFVEDLYSKDDWKVWSYNEVRQSGEWQSISNAALMEKDAQLMKITDEVTGKSIKCTPEHKVFTQNRGYVMACNLKEDDELLIG